MINYNPPLMITDPPLIHVIHEVTVVVKITQNPAVLAMALLINNIRLQAYATANVFHELSFFFSNCESFPSKV